MKWSTDFQLWWWVKVEKLDGLISICILICRHIVTHSGYQEPRSGAKKVRSWDVSSSFFLGEWMKMGCQVLITPQHHSWCPQPQSTCNGRRSWIADGSWWVRIQVEFSRRSMSQLLIRQKRSWIPLFYLFLSGVWVARLSFFWHRRLVHFTSMDHGLIDFSWWISEWGSSRVCLLEPSHLAGWLCFRPSDLQLCWGSQVTTSTQTPKRG